MNFILSVDVNETGALGFAGIRKRFIFAKDTFEANFSTLLHISKIYVLLTSHLQSEWRKLHNY